VRGSCWGLVVGFPCSAQYWLVHVLVFVAVAAFSSVEVFED